MRDFIHGWKRKVGCATLAMACVFAAGWVRSLSVNDMFVIYHNLDARIPGDKPITAVIYSSQGELAWQRNEGYIELVFAERWAAIVDRGYRWTTQEQLPMFMDRRNRRLLLKYGFALIRNPQLDTKPIWLVAIPYWSIVAPLTLISAWLLFSKPRTRRSTALADSAPTDQEVC